MQGSDRKQLADRLEKVELLAGDIISINKLPWVVRASEEMARHATFLKKAVETPCISGPTEVPVTTQKES